MYVLLFNNLFFQTTENLIVSPLQTEKEYLLLLLLCYVTILTQIVILKTVCNYSVFLLREVLKWII